MEQKKKALGRGLEQLFSSEILDFDSFESNIMENATESDIKELPISEIRPNPYQPRKTFNQEALDELAESIKNYGVFQPIIVKKSIKGYDLVAGERRLRASKLAGLTTIPAIIKEFSDSQMREIALLENLQRENLTAIELAWAYKGIIDSLHIKQEELAEKMHTTVDKIRDIYKISQEPVSLETPIGEEEDSHLGDFIKDERNVSPEEYATNEMLKDEISKVLLTLTEREEKVIRLRFGLEDGKSRTLEEVGQLFGVTRERIRQIEAKALRKLRHPSRSRKLKDYMGE